MTDGAVEPDQEGLGAAGIRAFTNISRLWGLSDEEQAAAVGAPSVATLAAWKSDAFAGKSVRIPKPTLERIGAVLGIFRSLHYLLPSDEARARWLRAPNDAALCEGRTALELMSEADDRGLFSVLQYLKAEVQG